MQPCVATMDYGACTSADARLSMDGGLAISPSSCVGAVPSVRLWTLDTLQIAFFIIIFLRTFICGCYLSLPDKFICDMHILLFLTP